MRLVASMILGLVATASFGQITAHEQSIQLAFNKLRTEQEIMLTLEGVEKIGNKVNNLSSNAFFKWDPLDPEKALVQSEMNDWVNGAHTRRIVGDGTTLWNYGFVQNAYTTFRYGAYSGNRPEGFRSNMLSELTTASKGPSSYMARAMKEIFSGKEAQYRTWLPMAQVTVVGTGDSMDDPIVPRTYTGSSNDMFVVYTYNSRLLRSGAFHLQRPDPSSEWFLHAIYFADKQQITPTSSKVMDWMITFTTGTLPTVQRYTFIPPTSAKPIANVRNGG